MNKLYNVLLTPVISEKSVSQSAGNHYIFYVNKDANKIDVAQAIHTIYGVSPVSIKILRMPKKISGRGRVKRKERKKAVIVLKKDEKLDLNKMQLA
ncbi:MAG: 50S ribosomal protein L23 [Candidatus Abawacabacteria bacterium]|nr:50S ribosomal protein L23 [Candidatus Abawacabacteria bacterium]